MKSKIKNKLIAMAVTIIAVLGIMPLSAHAETETAENHAPEVTFGQIGGQVVKQSQELVNKDNPNGYGFVKITAKDPDKDGIAYIMYSWDYELEKNDPTILTYHKMEASHTENINVPQTNGLHVLSVCAVDQKGKKSAWIETPYYIVDKKSETPDTTAPVINQDHTDELPRSFKTIDAGRDITVRAEDEESGIYYIAYNWTKKGEAKPELDDYTIVYQPRDQKITFKAPRELGTWNLRIFAGNSTVDEEENIFMNSNVIRFEYTIDDFTSPVVTLNGENPVELIENETYTDQGAKVTDNCDDDKTIYATNIQELIDNNIVVADGNNYTFAKRGTYTLNYNTTDAKGNASETITRTIKVIGEKEIINLTLPDKTIYKYEEALDLTGASIEVISKTGEVSNVPVTTDMFLNFSTTKLGGHTATFEYELNGQKKTLEYAYTVNDFVEKIEVTAPTKTEYDYKEALDLRGGSVKVIMATGDYSVVPLTSDMLADDFNSEVLGMQTIHVNYRDKEGTFKVEIKDLTEPELTINEQEIRVEIGTQIPASTLNDYTVSDLYDDEHGITVNVNVDDSKVDTSRIGEYEIIYTATDSHENSTIKTRRVTVYIDENNQDLKDLNDAKAEVDKLDPDDYTEDSWKKVEDALKLPEETIQEIKDKTQAIKDAIDSLVKKDLDLTKYNELRKIIDELKTHKNDYTEASWKNLEQKSTAANKAKETGLQSKLDPAVDELEKAIKALVAKPVNQDAITDLENYIKENFKEDDYTPESWQKLQDEIEEAKKITDLQSKFDEAIKNIKTELEKELNNKPNDILVRKDVDFTKLDDIKDKLSKVDEKDYTAESWNDIQDKISEAEKAELQSKLEELLNNIDLSTLVLKPVISNVQIDTTNSNKAFAKVDDIITVTFNTNIPLDMNGTTVKLNNSKINLEKVSEENITISKDEPTKPTQNSYKATFKMDNGCIEGKISYSIFAIEARHVEENEQKQSANSSGDTGITFDKTVPTIVFAQDIGNKTIEVKTEYEIKESDVKVSDNLTATDKLDVKIESSLNVNVVGNYEVKYVVKDLAGNEASITRTITVEDSTAPVITLNGDNPVTIEVGQKYEEKGAIVTDNYDTDIQSKLNIDSTALNIYKAGKYEIIYTVTDSNGNTAEVKRAVVVLYKGYLKDAIKRTEGLIESDYDADAWKKLQDALKMPETTQAEIDAKTDAINNAVDNLLNNKKALNTTEFDKLKDKIDDLTSSDYTPETWNPVQDKKTEIENAITSGNLLQSELDEKIKELQDLIDKLQAKPVDQSAIGIIEDNLKNNYVESDYTPESWEKLQNEIEDAKKITDLQSKFDDAVNKIQQDITGTPSILVPKKLDTKALDDIIAKVNKLNKDDYTETSWKALGSLIAKAKQQTLQSKLDEAVSKIDLSTLVLKPVISNVQVDTTNSNKAFAKAGDTITLTFESNVELDLTKTTVQLNSTPINITKVDNKYKATFTMNDRCVEREITYSIHAVETRESAEIDKTGKTGIIFDKTAPIIAFASGIGDATIKYGADYKPSNNDVVVTETNQYKVEITPENFNSKALGNHVIMYKAIDAAGNESNIISRTIIVKDYVSGIKVNKLPNKDTYRKDETLDVTGGTIQLVLASGAVGQIIDMNDSNVTIEGFSTTTPGTITLTVKYNHVGKIFTNTFELIILDSEKPTIKLIGDKAIYLEVGSTYTELGAIVEDNVDKNLVVSIKGTVDTSKLGDYEIYYSVTDTAGNTATEKRTIHVVDRTKPVINELIGANPLQLEAGQEYVEPGAKATDNYDGDISNKVQVVEKDLKKLQDNIKVPGTYTLRYYVTDASGNTSYVTDDFGNNSEYVIRTVIIKDTTAPVITLKGDAEITLEAKQDTYTEPGVTITDVVDTGLTPTITGTVNTNVVGDYTLTYNVTDTAGNVATPVTRVVHVKDTTVPTIRLEGNETVKVAVKGTYIDKGAKATDTYDGDITNKIVVNNPVDVNKVGEYTITYNVVDSNGNNAEEVTRKVIVVDKEAPVATLNGENEISIIAGDEFTDPGITVTDNYDENCEVTIEVAEGKFDANKEGVYHLTYYATDSSGNKSNEVTRTITVREVPPKISVVIDGNNEELTEGKVFKKDIEISFDKGTLVIERTNNGNKETITVTDPKEPIKLADGEYKVIADASGSKTEINFVIDSIPPVVNLRTGFYNESATITFEKPDDVHSAILVSSNDPIEIKNQYNNETGITITEKGIYSLFAFDKYGNYTKIDFEVK